VYLLDTNILLELLLDQEKAEEVEKMLRACPRGSLFLSEFSYYSVGIVLFRRGRLDSFLAMGRDLLTSERVSLLRLNPDDMRTVAEASKRFNLDFDDAYQYCAHRKHGLELVSFDTDFDKTDCERKTPTDVIALLPRSEQP